MRATTQRILQDQQRDERIKKVIGAVAVVLVASVIVYWYRGEIERASVIATLFTGVEQYENFSRMNGLLPVTTMTASGSPQQLISGAGVAG